MVQLPPERLGSFFLGARYDLGPGEMGEEAINYDARDLTTHAVCVGMTGSGKTGLCVGLLEEAAIDKVPAIIIDPKGDMTNLMLQFEDLEASDFKKWINSDDAGRKGMSIDEYAEATAAKWKKGLSGWGQGKDRISMLKSSVDYTIFTPGSDSGIPINILGSFAAPGIDFDSDSEMLRERIQGNVAALLGMIGSDEDPSRSREGILLSSLFEHHWRAGNDLDLTSLIMGIQKPPFQQLGVFDIETFFPEKDRFELAMAFNTLVASPQFSYWLQGEPLDIDKLYYTLEGKPRHSIFYIAHLSDSERMFFVTLLLNSLISWMRRQSGTTSLRSLLYFDEIFGYFPPTANPPSKRPLLTILKQARAFGVGAVLVTQNPVDIDYKGLSNAGTWFIGKLQTERDKARVLDGLKGAIAEAGSSGSGNFSSMISALSSRVFLLHNVHGDEPQVFHTRWVMSYLRGPMTRPQVKLLMEDKKSAGASDVKDSASAKKESGQGRAASHSMAPTLEPGIRQVYLKPSGGNIGNIEYSPTILAAAKVRFYDSRRSVDQVKAMAILAKGADEFGRVDWDTGIGLDSWSRQISDSPMHGDDAQVSYEDIPESMKTEKDFKKIESEFDDWLYQNEKFPIYEHKKLKLTQQEDESVEAFQMRVNTAARELRDEALDELQEKYADKLDRIDDKIRKEEHDLEQLESEVRHRKTAEMVGMAETLFSVFVKGRSRSFSSATSKSRMRRKASQRLEESKEDLMDLQDDYMEMENELKEKAEELREEWDRIAEGISVVEVKPRRTDIVVEQVMLAWFPS